MQSSMAATTGETIRAMTSTWLATPLRARLRAVAMLCGIIGLSIAAVLAPIDYHALGNYGYLGVFMITLISTGSLILPVPYLAAVVIAGSFLDPRMVALVAGSAAALGELTGYGLGYSGRALLPENRWSALLQQSMARYGIPIIFVFAVIPNPFFDAVGMIAGASRFPIWSFLGSAFVGKTLRFLLLAMLGGTMVHS